MMKLKLGQMLQIKSYFKRKERSCSHHRAYSVLHINILRGYRFSIQAFKSQMCFNQKSTTEIRKFFAVPGQKAREIVQDQTCTEKQKIVTSHSKTLLKTSRCVAVRQLFSSHSNELQAVQKILSSLRMARAIRPKKLLSSVRKPRRSYPFQINHQLFELFVTRALCLRKENCHPFELVRAVPKIIKLLS